MSHKVDKQIEAEQIVLVDGVSADGDGELGCRSAGVIRHQGRERTLGDLFGQLDSLRDGVCSRVDGALDSCVGVSTGHFSGEQEEGSMRLGTHASSQMSKVFWRSLIKPSLTVTSAVAPSCGQCYSKQREDKAAVIKGSESGVKGERGVMTRDENVPRSPARLQRQP